MTNISLDTVPDSGNLVSTFSSALSLGAAYMENTTPWKMVLKWTPESDQLSAFVVAVCHV